MDRAPIPLSDDVDLDALMLRVRDAARTNTAGGVALQAQAVRADATPELDLIRVLEAQEDWNEHARQSFVALADGIRTLRDDWAEVEAGLRREIARLSAVVEELRARPRRAGSPRRTKRRAAPQRRP